MPVVFAAVAPHGYPIIPDLSDDAEGALATGAAEVDGRVVDAIRAGEPARLLDVSDEDAAESAVDGVGQTLILGGLLERVPMTVDLLSYEAPSSYGMLVASAPAADGQG